MKRLTNRSISFKNNHARRIAHHDTPADTAAQERQELEMLLKQERERAASVEQMMRVLFHDLRIPLAVINTSTGLLNRHGDKFPPQLRSEKYASIQMQVRHMSKMIEDASLALRGALSDTSYQPKCINLIQLCDVCVSEIKDAVATENHRLRIETDGEVTYVKLDETLISRMLINLLTNAIKYSPDGGEVKLALTREENDIVIEISDQGMGIAPKDQVHIFDAFYRTENVQTISGAGLGLSIVRDCVQQHGGQIQVYSAIGYGTTFTVRLPYITVEIEASTPESEIATAEVKIPPTEAKFKTA